jgi:hypothetical protein
MKKMTAQRKLGANLALTVALLVKYLACLSILRHIWNHAAYDKMRDRKSFSTNLICTVTENLETIKVPSTPLEIREDGTK